MFGLMRAKKCGMSADEKNFRRLNYCGTCKTIGAIYGQKARMLLNHDTVFLAELLTALSGGEAAKWEGSYQSYNCLSLPQQETPLALHFAATVNIILTEFKLQDHLTDEKKRRYKFTQSLYSKEFRQAENILRDWSFPLETVKAVLASQTKREDTEKNLDELTYPTAQTTAIFFCEGVKLTGQTEAENIAFELGFNFGKLIYLLDAYEDYKKDFQAGKFNAFRAAFDLTSESLSPETKRRIVKTLRDAEDRVIENIRALPLSENQKTLFISRLSQNLNRKLKTTLPVVKKEKSCAVKPRQSFKDRWRAATTKARNLAGNYSWQMPVVFLFVFAFALVAPAQEVREVKSARECFDLSFNLMFLGAIFGSVLAFPKPVLQKFPKRKKKQEEGGGDGDDSSEPWCDGCDCCDCGCCCCECGGESGCCDSCDCNGCCDCGDCCNCSCD